MKTWKPIKAVGDQFLSDPCGIGHICSPCEAWEDEIKRRRYQDGQDFKASTGKRLRKRVSESKEGEESSKRSKSLPTRKSDGAVKTETGDYYEYMLKYLSENSMSSKE
ncbi:hypothetical protein COOONC_21816 [Cooperia oncophora]